MGREYARYYDHEDFFHRQKEAPKKVEHIHPMDMPAKEEKPKDEKKISLNNLVQEGSIPACNSHDFPKCKHEA